MATIVAAVVSFAVVRWLLRYVQTHTFIPFGWYRIGLGILIFGLLLQEQRRHIASPGRITSFEFRFAIHPVEARLLGVCLKFNPSSSILRPQPGC